MLPLQGKVIVVTGGAQGIGGATARLAAARGATAVMADIAADLGEKAQVAMHADGLKGEFVRTDVRDDAAVAALFDGVRARHGRLDGLVCAAGVLKGAFLQPEDFPLDTFEWVLDVNVMGTFRCVQRATPLLAESKGVAVLIASGAGVSGPSSSLAYGASKGGVNGLGMTLANHLAPRGVRVNVVCPGNIATTLKREQMAVAAQHQGLTAAQAAQAVAELGSPDGVAKVIAFLLSDDAAYVRGTLFTR